MTRLTLSVVQTGDAYERIGAPVGASISADISAIAGYLDTEVTTIIDRVLGLVLDNHVEDDIVRDTNGLKTSSIIYAYNSAANATTHDKVTGVVGKYVVAVAYSGGRMTKLTSTRVI
jgi:hypothetical protein